jgi:hypothetical protein
MEGKTIVKSSRNGGYVRGERERRRKKKWMDGINERKEEKKKGNDDHP